MAEKWDESANDSPEVVYEGFSPPATHSQGMISAGSSFVAATDGTESGQQQQQQMVGGSTGAPFMTGSHVMENQGEGSHHEEVDRSRLCFVCCNPVSDKNFESIKTSMNHSHAPLLVLLTDVLGYKLEEGRLHSQVVCKACYHLLDIIDELQQTLTESKTDVRTKFLETVQRMKLKYPRTDKMLKPRCLRCIQMSQSSARKRGRGRGWKGRADDGIRGRGRGRGGRGRGRSQSNDGSDNDGEGLGVCEGEICKDVLPSKSLHQSSSRGNALKIRDKSGDGGDVPFLTRNLPSYTDCSCVEMCPTSYECLMCRKSDTEVYYQYCESCMTCQGTFVPWGINVTLKFVGDQCSITQINAQSYFDDDVLFLLTKGLRLLKPADEFSKEVDGDEDQDEDSQSVAAVKKSSAVKKSKVAVNAGIDDDSDGKVKEKDDAGEEKTQKSVTKVVKKETEVEDSDNEREYFMGGVCTETSDSDPDVAESKTPSKCPSRCGPRKSDISDIDTLYKPILKIQESRKVKKPTRCKPQQRKTLSDEFESIQSRPSLGKRKIKPTEKVKWLADRCVSRRRETQQVNENISKVKEIKVKEEKEEATTVKRKKSPKTEKETGETSDKNQLDSEVSQGKRKRKFTEKAQEMDENQGANIVNGSPKVKEAEEQANVATKEEEASEKDIDTICEDQQHESDVDHDYQSEGVNEEEQEEEEEEEKGDGGSDGEGITKTVIKTEVLDGIWENEQKSSDTEKVESPVKAAKGSLQQTGASREMTRIGTGELTFTRKRGRRPGKRRKKRSFGKAKHMWEDFEDEQLIVKTDDGKEIDLAGLSVKNLQEGDQLYKCPVCSKEYKSQGGMQYHLATHTSTARYSCSLCSYRTIRYGDLKKHFVIHTGLKPYKCDVCQQEFSTSSSFKRHLRIHSGEKPYKCEVCEKSFRNITTRKQHMILHTGIKNFVCEVCGKSFSLKHHYTSHRKRHNGEMPFKCIHCDGAFKTHNAVKTHRKKEHPVEEAERIQQNRLRRKSAIKEEKTIKIEEDNISPDHEVFGSPGDVLEQAMAATVETIDGAHYEYVDVADPSIPLVSKMIKENWNGRDSVVLTITHIEEDEYNESDEEM